MATVKQCLIDIVAGILNESMNISIGTELGSIIINFWIWDEFENIFVRSPQHQQDTAHILKCLLRSSKRYIELFLKIQYRLIIIPKYELTKKQVRYERSIETDCGKVDFDETIINNNIIKNSSKIAYYKYLNQCVDTATIQKTCFWDLNKHKQGDDIQASYINIINAKNALQLIDKIINNNSSISNHDMEYIYKYLNNSKLFKLQLFYEVILFIMPYIYVNIKYNNNLNNIDLNQFVLNQIELNGQDIITQMRNKYFNKNIIKHDSKCMCTKCRKLSG